MLCSQTRQGSAAQILQILDTTGVVTEKIGYSGVSVFVCWLLNVPATCISGPDLLRQSYVQPH